MKLQLRINLMKSMKLNLAAVFLEIAVHLQLHKEYGIGKWFYEKRTQKMHNRYLR